MYIYIYIYVFIIILILSCPRNLTPRNVSHRFSCVRAAARTHTRHTVSHTFKNITPVWLPHKRPIRRTAAWLQQGARRYDIPTGGGRVITPTVLRGKRRRPVVARPAWKRRCGHPGSIFSFFFFFFSVAVTYYIRICIARRVR